MRYLRVHFALLLACLLLLAGCQSTVQPPSTPVAQNTPAAQSTPAATKAAASGGTVIFGTTFEPKIINGLSAEQVSKWITDMVFDGLVRANTKQELVGKLAQSWEVSSDGKVYTFKLKPGVKFQDGTDLTADDVVFTYQTAMNPPAGMAFLAKSDYAVIDKIEAVDPQTVRFTLKMLDAAFLSKLQAGILPKHLLGSNPDWASYNRKPVGTGAWIVDSWNTGQQIVFKANPNYFDGKPALSQFIWKVVPDANVLAAQLDNGEVDMAFVDTRSLERVKQNPKLATAEWLGALTYIGLNHDNPLFQDVRVRQALALGLNKQDIINKLLQGQAVPATLHMTPSNWSYNQNAKPWGYDPDQARKLLDEAGWKPGADGIRVKDGKPFKFVLLTNSEQPERRDITVLARQQWREIGVDVEPQYLELNTFISEYVLKSKFDAILLAGTVNIDPDYLRRNLATLGDSSNFLRYNNPDVNKLLDEGRSKTSQAERKPIYDKAQEIAQNDVALIGLYYPKSVVGFRKDLQGVDPTDLNVFWNTQTWHYAK